MPDPGVIGKANFGFVSKYKKGADIPTGHTEFHLNLADFKFKSTAYIWLVVSGHKAEYKGTGTVNDEPGYGFQLTAYDGALKNPPEPDKFRIRFWDTNQGNAVVYDNRLGISDDIDHADPQVIDGGSIVIHKGGKSYEGGGNRQGRLIAALRPAGDAGMFIEAPVEARTITRLEERQPATSDGNTFSSIVEGGAANINGSGSTSARTFNRVQMVDIGVEIEWMSDDAMKSERWLGEI